MEQTRPSDQKTFTDTNETSEYRLLNHESIDFVPTSDATTIVIGLDGIAKEVDLLAELMIAQQTEGATPVEMVRVVKDGSDIYVVPTNPTSLHMDLADATALNSDKNLITIGRNHGDVVNDIGFDGKLPGAKAISRKHATVELVGDMVRVTDTSSYKTGVTVYKSAESAEEDDDDATIPREQVMQMLAAAEQETSEETPAAQDEARVVGRVALAGVENSSLGSQIDAINEGRGTEYSIDLDIEEESPLDVVLDESNEDETDEEPKDEQLKQTVMTELERARGEVLNNLNGLDQLGNFANNLSRALQESAYGVSPDAQRRVLQEIIQQTQMLERLSVTLTSLESGSTVDQFIQNEQLAGLAGNSKRAFIELKNNVYALEGGYRPDRGLQDDLGLVEVIERQSRNLNTDLEQIRALLQNAQIELEQT